MTKVLLTLFLSSIILFGCQTASPNTSIQPDSVSSTEVSSIHVKPASPKKISGDTEEFPLPNCGGTGELSQSLGTQVSVSKSVIVGGTATVTGGGEINVPETAKIALEISIEASYQQEYETANSRLDSVEMKAAPASHVIYVIQWEKQEFSSVVTYEMDGELLESPYTFTMSVPKFKDSYQEICPTDIGHTIPPTPISTTESKTDTSPTITESEAGPLRPHYQVVVGDGIFSAGTFSDGLAPHSEDWLWGNNHFDIQRIRQEEYPSGCDISRYNTNLVWISGSSGMQFSINDEIVGTYNIADNAHGYMFEKQIRMGDKLCAVNFRSIGYQIVLGPDIYYHYDSYCYRGACK